MRADPVRQLLAPGRLGVGEAGGAEHGDEDLHRARSRRYWRRSPPRCGRRNRRTASRRRRGPGASSASAGRPRPGRGRRTRNSRSRRARRRGTPPTAAPASRRAGAARDAPRPNPAADADRPGCRQVGGNSSASSSASSRSSGSGQAQAGGARPAQIARHRALAQPEAAGHRPLRQPTFPAQSQNFTDLAHRQSLGRHLVPPFDKEDEATFG